MTMNSRLPRKFIDLDGRRIAVEMIEQTISGEKSTALYKDNLGNLYVVGVGHGDSNIAVRAVNERQALQWYLAEFLNDGFLKEKFAAAVARFPDSERPLWPCCEKINGVVYDSQTAQHVAGVAGTTLFRSHRDETRPANYFFATRGAHIRPCSLSEAVEAILSYNLFPMCFRDFAEYMPSQKW